MQMTALVKSQTPDISIIIPAFNEVDVIGATLEAVAELRGRVEVTVVDGGSSDETVEIARKRSVKVITSERGRGSQLHAGACAGRGEALWFLHADTRPSADSVERVLEALSGPGVVAGNFCVHFDAQCVSARFLTWLYPRLRLLGLCYGDSAIFVRSECYKAIGGFKPFPIFEGLDLIRRLRREGQVVHIPAVVVTSSRRFEGRSFALTFARWACMQVLYWLGVRPTLLDRFYLPIRSRRS